VKEGQQHGLKEAGEMTPYGEIYSVAVFHQIHCLGMLRGNYWELLERAFVQDDLVSQLYIRIVCPTLPNYM
jgi:Mycotoxin biosynthesis protein UstYa